ncbi:hypothetical protein Tco_1462971 [Tanacetum coccineum]
MLRLANIDRLSEMKDSGSDDDENEFFFPENDKIGIQFDIRLKSRVCGVAYVIGGDEELRSHPLHLNVF